MDSCLTDRLQYFRRINDVGAATLAAGRQAQHANLPRDGPRVGGATEAGAARGAAQGGTFTWSALQDLSKANA